MAFYLDSDAKAEAERLLRDFTRYALFDQHGAVLAASFQADPSELAELARAFDLDRDDAIRRGMVLAGARYEVHRHHPSAPSDDGSGAGAGLIYGRTMTAPADSAAAAAGGGGAAGHGHAGAGAGGGGASSSSDPAAVGAGGAEGDHGGPAGARGVYGARAWAEGAAVCRVRPSRAPGGAPLFGAATYALPHVSARMVPLLREACERLMGPAGGGGGA